MTRRRAARISAVLTGLLVIAALAAVLVVRSDWFLNKVRARIIDTVETATGGHVDLASFSFDWTRMRAEVGGFAIHGLEPADKPALFRATSIAVGLKIVSIMKRDV